MNIASFSNAEFYQIELTAALEGIESIEPRIHKVRLSSMAKFSELFECLPGLTQRVADGHMPGYDWMAYFWIKKTMFKVYYGGDPWLPRAIFDVVEPTPASLVRLYKWVKSPIYVASAEYAIDFKCGDEHRKVQRVFKSIRRHLYLPWRSGSVETLGGSISGWKGDYDENSLTRYWNRPNKHTGKSTNAVRLYERGEDEDIELGRPHWLMKNVNRVRLEFLFSNKRHRAMFRKYQLRDLEGFTICPMMSEVLRGKFRFATFESIKGGKLPLEWMNYSEKDDSGCANCFHQEHKEAKKKVSNLSKYTNDSALMAPLMRKIEAALLKYDAKWVEGAKRAKRVRAYKDFGMCFRDEDKPEESCT